MGLNRALPLSRAACHEICSAVDSCWRCDSPCVSGLPCGGGAVSRAVGVDGGAISRWVTDTLWLGFLLLYCSTKHGLSFANPSPSPTGRDSRHVIKRGRAGYVRVAITVLKFSNIQ